MPSRRKKKKSKALFKGPTYVKLKPASSKDVKRIITAVRYAAITLLIFFLFKIGYDLLQRSQALQKTSVETTLQKKKAVKPLPPPKTAAKPMAQAKSIADFRPTTAKKNRPVSDQAPKVVIVIDDIGNTQDHLSLLESLKDDVTYAILPHLKYSEQFSRLSEVTKAEVILHLPLEASDGTIPGPGLITTRMPPSQIREMLNRDLHTVPHSVGVNNHMGSLGTANPEVMKLVLSELKAKGMFFLDSRTTPASKAEEVAQRLSFTILEREIFLDNTDSQEAVRDQLHELVQTSYRKGYAVGIGHYRYNTLKVLNEEIPKIRASGIEVISLAELLAWKEKFNR